MDLSSTAVGSKTFTMRQEGYDVSEVETFLRAVSARLGELEAQVAGSTASSDSSKDGLRADAERLARIADVELAAGRRASFDSRITLDALQDAQADLVARVESTAKDLHDALERDGRVPNRRHLSANTWRAPSTSTSSAAPASTSTPSATTSTAAATSEAVPAAPVADPATPEPTSKSPVEPVAPTPAVAAPEPEPVPATTDLAAVLADLDKDPLGDASNALDDVLDDVMGSLRPKD